MAVASGENFLRDRWSYDKFVRTTHGVNCTGSCSWNIYVKNGVVAWENQAIDYPETPDDMPDYEPVQFTPCVVRTTLS